MIFLVQFCNKHFGLKFFKDLKLYLCPVFSLSKFTHASLIAVEITVDYLYQLVRVSNSWAITRSFQTVILTFTWFRYSFEFALIGSQRNNTRRVFNPDITTYRRWNLIRSMKAVIKTTFFTFYNRQFTSFLKQVRQTFLIQ